MSQENVDLVLTAFRAVAPPNADWKAATPLFHPEHVFIGAGGIGIEVLGRRAYREWSEDSSELTWEADVESAVDVGPRTVLVAGTVRSRGASSGASVVNRIWFLGTVADGQVIRTQAFLDPADAMREALEAAGPSE